MPIVPSKSSVIDKRGLTALIRDDSTSTGSSRVGKVVSGARRGCTSGELLNLNAAYHR